ncbi:MAG: hypothetical protein IJN34_02690 [Clostridia bacterium]|nr:hypothetical protein [Clostridia bacterium]
MEIQLQSDGQLYPPRHAERPKPPPPKPPTPQEPPPPPAPPPPPPGKEPMPAIPWEDLLLAGVAFLILRSSEKPDIPLLLALAYILFDQQFDFHSFFKGQ